MFKAISNCFTNNQSEQNNDSTRIIRYKFTSKIISRFQNLFDSNNNHELFIEELRSLQPYLRARGFIYSSPDKEVLGKTYLLMTWEILLDNTKYHTYQNSGLIYSCITFIYKREEFFLENNGYLTNYRKISPYYLCILLTFIRLLQSTLYISVFILKSNDKGYKLDFASDVVSFACFHLPVFREQFYATILRHQPPVPPDLMDICGDIINRREQNSDMFVFENTNHTVLSSTVNPSSSVNMTPTTMNSTISSLNTGIYNTNNVSIDRVIKEQYNKLTECIYNNEQYKTEINNAEVSPSDSYDTINAINNNNNTNNNTNNNNNNNNTSNSNINNTSNTNNNNNDKNHSIPSSIYYKQFFSSSYMNFHVPDQPVSQSKPFMGLGPLSVNESYDIDKSELPDIYILNYADYIDHLCRQAMYSKYIYDKGQEYALASNNIYDWNIMTNYYDPITIDFDWSIRFNYEDSFMFLFIMNWIKYIYVYSSCRPIVWEVIPGYFLILREFFTRFQQCIYSQYLIGQLRDTNIGHNYLYNSYAQECTKYILYNPQLIQPFMEIIICRCNINCVSDITLCLEYLNILNDVYKEINSKTNENDNDNEDIINMNKISPAIKTLCLLQIRNYKNKVFPRSNYPDLKTKLKLDDSSSQPSYDCEYYTGFTILQALEALKKSGIALTQNEALDMWLLLKDNQYIYEVYYIFDTNEYIYHVPSVLTSFDIPEVNSYYLRSSFSTVLLFQALDVLLTQERFQVLGPVLIYIYNSMGNFYGEYRKHFIEKCIFPQFLRLFCHWNNDVRYLFQCICIYKLFRTRRDQLPCFKSEDILSLLPLEVIKYNIDINGGLNESDKILYDSLYKDYLKHKPRLYKYMHSSSINNKGTNETTSKTNKNQNSSSTKSFLTNSKLLNSKNNLNHSYFESFTENDTNLRDDGYLVIRSKPNQNTKKSSSTKNSSTNHSISSSSKKDPKSIKCDTYMNGDRYREERKLKESANYNTYSGYNETNAIDLVECSKLDSYLLLCIQQCINPTEIEIPKLYHPYLWFTLFEYSSLLNQYEKEMKKLSEDELPSLSIDPKLFLKRFDMP